MIKRALIPAVLALGIGLAVPQQASAVAWVMSGTSIIHHTANTGYVQTGSAVWDATVPGGDEIDLHMYSSQLSANHCTDAVFDWSTAGHGHFDARIIRVCRDDATRENVGTKTELAPAAYLVGVQKLGVCMWDKTLNNGDGGRPTGGCTNYPALDMSVFGVPATWGVCSARMWARFVNGTTGYQDGGDPYKGTGTAGACD